MANISGKGRNDFKLDLFIKCQAILTKSEGSSLAVKRLAEQVEKTFSLFRVLIRKYAENIEVVDPMLRNNQELADVMGDLEKAWSLARDQMMDQDKLEHLESLS